MRVLCFTFALGILGVPAAADEMVVGNATLYAITKLRVPTSGADPTSEILNPGQTIAPGTTLSLEYNPTTDGCFFDVWAMFENETVRMIEAYNPCDVTDLNDEGQWAVFSD